ncbi:amidohydrolase [Marinobacter salinisoli]|uniref:Amidohydrolase n=1 Tax=Marinobacter salinisoli TaxID=2769486 RepID=A0ABX7MSP1_9GAMM|nr:amidohydrolase [Marinobacter salinisoli]QSP95397.1 amidohydrolase [Marinobacter salinisoli]
MVDWSCFTRGLCAIFLGLILNSPAHAAEMADRIFLGGPVLTMDDGTPQAEAVAIKDGRILSVGTEAQVLDRKGEDTTIHDLQGRVLLPGFVDSHGHVVMGGLQALSANLLAPPDGEVRDIPGVVDALGVWFENNAEVAQRVNLIAGFGYDQSQLEEGRHPTREDLDQVSTDIPVVVIHQSGHFGVMNSKGLEVVGIDRGSEDPNGGVIRRGEDGEPNGVLEENAFFMALAKLVGGIGPDGFKAFVKAGAGLWASYGYTTAQEGRASPQTTEIVKAFSAEEALPVDIVIYPDVLLDRDFIADNAALSYVNRVRVGGAKLTIDGSPQGFTALRDRPYYDPVGNYPPGYAGYAAATMEQVVSSVDWAFDNDIQLLTHANGEGASDMLLAAIKAATEARGGKDRRPVLIHGQFLREDQVDSLKALDIFPSVFPMHTFYWGDWHREHTVGPVNAENISPTGWIRQRGMKFGTHHDAPVAFPDSMRVLDATVTRRTRSGDILGPSQRVDVMTALKAMTIWPAWQHFEEKEKGSIEVGKLADFVILSANPLTVDPENLDQLRVVETFKDGELVYRADDTGYQGAFPAGTSMAVGREFLEALEESETAGK